ncbi:MAG: hypothetical protein ABIP54_02580, partial [Candidatus Andersenbacteria bacterium]
TPNTVSITVTSPVQSSVVINANYADGWVVNGKPAKNIQNKVGTDIPAGTTVLKFQYVPKGMWVGLIITILTVLGLLSSYYIKDKRNAS